MNKEDWIASFSKIIKKQPFYSEDLEKCLTTFAATTLLESETLKQAFGIKDLSLLYKDAYVNYQNRQYAVSEQLFRLAVILDPLSKDHWTGLGLSLQELARYEEALKCYHVVTLIDRNNPYPHFYSYQCFKALRNNKEEKKALEKAYKYATLLSLYSELKRKIENICQFSQ